MPYHQVSRFQAIAESSAATTSCCVASSGGDDPLADGRGDGGAGQRADDVEDGRHQHGLAGREDARGDGGGDRVGGVVEAVDEVEGQRQGHDRSAMRTQQLWPSVLGILEEDAFERVGDVLGPVGGVFEQAVELAPAEARGSATGCRHAVVEGGEGLVEHVVGLVLGAVELQDVPRSSIGRLPACSGAGRPGDRLAPARSRMRAKRRGGLGGRAQPVEAEALADLLDVVDEVVDRRRRGAGYPRGRAG